MEYCPYCSTPLYKAQKVCPECKKSLDLDVLQSLYKSPETSGINTKIKKRIWFREHSHIINPIIALFIGLIVGALAAYSAAQIQFVNQRADYENEIANLQNQINSGKSSAASEKGALEGQLQNKDQIIQILQEQQNITSRVINFTRRLANNSTITPNTVEEGSYYDRNIRYLIRQFEGQKEQLQTAGYESIQNYNLQTIPQLITE